TQMLAAAVNAHAFYLEYNEYPEDFYQLYNAPSWNLELYNIFTGQTINAVYYDPEEVGKTNIPSSGLMNELKPLDTSIPVPPPSGPQTMDNPIVPLNTSTGPMRVDATDVPSPTPGDLLYFANGSLLQ